MERGGNGCGGGVVALAVPITIGGSAAFIAVTAMACDVLILPGIDQFPVG